MMTRFSSHTPAASDAGTLGTLVRLPPAAPPRSGLGGALREVKH